MKTIGDTLPRRFKAKASGSITAGKPCIVEADGDVAQVALVSVPQAIGSHVEPETNVAEYIDGAFDSTNNKVVFVYDDENADAAEAIIGTISGTSISFGTPVAFDTAPEYLRVTFNSSTGKVVAAYRDGDNSGYGTAVVGTVSGTSISFGTPVVFKSAESRYMAMDSADGSNVVIVYRGSTGYGHGIVGAISGTSISFGSATSISNSNNKFEFSAVTYDSNADKVLVSYHGDSNYGYSAVGTISSTSISFGTPAQFNGTNALLTSDSRSVSSAFDPNTNQVAIGFIDNSDSAKCKVVMATISGTSVSFGSVATANSGDCAYPSVQYHSAGEKVVVANRNATGTDDLEAAVGTVSGTGISFATAFTVDSADSGSPVYNWVSLVYDSNLTSLAVGYKSYDSNNRRFRCNVFQIAHNAPNLTSENYIGIAEYAAADTETATVFIKGGVSPDQSSLTPGQTYFVQTDGTIGTSAGTPSVTAGTAVTSTKLIVKG
jgi:hypothetical protein